MLSPSPSGQPVRFSIHALWEAILTLMSASRAALAPLLLLASSAQAAPAVRDDRPSPALPASAPAAQDDTKDDLPAPPIGLLFAIGAAGVLWGRRLAANARKTREQTETD